MGTRLDASVVEQLDELVTSLAWARSRGDLVRALVHYTVWNTPREQLAELFTRAWAFASVRERLGEADDALRGGAARELARAAAQQRRQERARERAAREAERGERRRQQREAALAALRAERAARLAERERAARLAAEGVEVRCPRCGARGRMLLDEPAVCRCGATLRRPPLQKK